MKVKKGMREIECFREDNSITLGMDETVFFEFHRHVSVGEEMEFEIGDESILKHLGTETEYIHPEKMKYPDWIGGDAEKGRWFFKTAASGTTTLAVRKVFRGTLESTCIITVVVK